MKYLQLISVVFLMTTLTTVYAADQSSQNTPQKHRAYVIPASPPQTPPDQPEEPYTTQRFHGFLELGTNRVWRGISFSNRGPGITGAIIYEHPTGIYGGLIGINSSVSNSGIGEVSVLGYKGQREKWDYDISARQEHYIKYNTRVIPDLYEFYGKVGYGFAKWAKVIAGIGYSPNYYFHSGTGWYTNARLELMLPCRFKLDGGAGYQTTQDGGKPGNLWYDNYLNWDVGIAKDFVGIIFGFRYTDTSLSRKGCNGGLICSPAYNLYAMKTF